MEDQVLYEDNHLLIINKKSGQLVQQDAQNQISLLEELKDWIKQKYNKPYNVFLGLVHRIDRPVSGIVIFAKTSKALNRINELFKNRKIKKTYWALIEKNKIIPAKNKLEHFLKKNTINNKSIVCNQNNPKVKKAVLNYEILTELEHYFLVEIELETGRHHQIRAQFSNIGCPIQGDVKYGAKRVNTDSSISLHARSIQFEHPVTKIEISITADFYESGIWKIIKNYEKN